MTSEFGESNAPLAVGLLGSFRLTVRGNGGVELKSKKARSILCYLLLHRDKEVDRRRLAGDLWPNSDDAAYNLRSDLVALRKALGSEENRIVNCSQQSLRFDITRAFVDLVVFDAAAKSAAAPITSESGADLLQNAVDLYRGELLEGCGDAWIDDYRSIRTADYRILLDRLVGWLLARRDFYSVAKYARRIIALEPTAERACRILMFALASQEQRAEALRVYGSFRRAVDESGAIPEPATRELFDAIHRQRPPRIPDLDWQGTQAAPAAVPHRQVSGTMPEAMRQNRLPYDDRPFIGRRKEREHLREKIIERRQRWITITGIGGMGKSRLALQSARDVETGFPDGVFYLDCEDLADRRDLAIGLSRTLIGNDVAPMSEDGLLRFLASRKALLLLDGFESLAPSWSLLETILKATPEVFLLVTSRVALEAPGEFEYPLQPMIADSDVLEVESDSMHLFAEAASHALHDFSIDVEKRAVVSNICRKLEGIPLAIVLAGRRLGLLSLEQLDAQLDERRFDVLKRRAVGNDRQSSLHQMLLALYDSLPAEEQALLLNLSVFAGGFDLASAVQVCGSQSAVFNGLELLRRHSLITVTRQVGRHRHQMLNTVREFLATLELDEKSAADVRACRERHSTYFSAIASQSKRELDAGHWVEGTGTIWVELANIRAAISFSIESSNDDLIMRFADALCRTFFESGLWTDFDRLNLVAESVANRHDNHDLSIKLLGLQGAAACVKKNYDAGVLLWERRIELAVGIGNTRAAADALLDLAWHYIGQDEDSLAASNLARGMSFARAHGLDDLIATGLAIEAKLSIKRAKPESSRQQAAEASEYARKSDQKDNILFVYKVVGQIYGQLGSYEEGIAVLHILLTAAQEGNKLFHLADGLMVLGSVYEAAQNPVFSAYSYQAAALLYRTLDIERCNTATERLNTVLISSGGTEAMLAVDEIADLTWKEALTKLRP